MRKKDNNKKNAIFEATIKTINDIGLVNISMSKIAKNAGVSASTLYVYFENKDDLIQKIYSDAKIRMLLSCLKGINENQNIQQAIRKIGENLLDFIHSNKNYFLFIEQTSNSPLINLNAEDEIINLENKLVGIFENGVKKGILKNISPVLLMSFCFYSISQLYKDENIEEILLKYIEFDSIFEMCWDAIKK